MMSDNDIYSQEFAVVSDAVSGGVPDPKQTKFRFLYEDLDSWIDLAGSFIRTRFKLVSTGTNDVAGVTIPDARSLWNQTILSLGGKEIENHSKDYWLYAQTSNKMWSDKYLNTVGTLMGLYKSRCGQPGLELVRSSGYDIETSNNTLFPIAINDLPGTAPNPIGSTSCMNYSKNGEGVLTSLENTTPNGGATVYTGTFIEFWTPLASMFGFCQAYPRVIKGLKTQIDLFKAQDKIRCYTPDNGNQPFATPTDQNLTLEWDSSRLVQLYVRRNSC